jgi:cysteine-rich repeat protein
MTSLPALVRFAPGAMALALVAGCPVQPLPAASFACSEASPECPPSSVCLVTADGLGGVCRPLGSFDETCAIFDPARAGLARAQGDGRRCGDPTTLKICIEGLCTPIACEDPRKEAQCGDGCRDSASGEVCDDGNTRDGDGCTGRCEVNTGYFCAPGDTGADVCVTQCGDLTTAGEERCDDGNDNPIDGCDDCRATKIVSDLVVSGSVDGVFGTKFELRAPVGITGGIDGALYIADTRGFRVLRHERRRGGPGSEDECGAALSGEPDTVVVAGGATGPPDFSKLDDRTRGINAVDARFCLPVSVVVDAFGNLYVADALAHRVYHVDVDGSIATVAGSTTPNGLCTAELGSVEVMNADEPMNAEDDGVRLNLPLSLAIDHETGDVYVLESGNRRVRRLRQREGEDPRHPRLWTIETVVGRACPLTADGDDSCSPSDEVPPSPADVRFGAGPFLGPGSLTFAPNGDLWVTDLFRPFGRGRLVQVRHRCLRAEDAPPDDGGACVRVVSTPRDGLLPTPTFPFGIHALADEGVFITDVANRKVWDIGVEPPRRMNLPTEVRAEDGTLLDDLNDPASLASIGSCVFIADPNANRVVAWSRQRDTLTQIVGDDGGEDPTRLDRPGQLSFDSTGRLYVIDSLGLGLHRFEIDAEQSVPIAADIVLGQGRIDLIELFGGNSARPEGLECIRGERLERFSFGQSQFVVGPEGLAVAAGADDDPIILVADSKARQILRLKEGELCDVSFRYPGEDDPSEEKLGLYCVDDKNPDYEPAFLRVVPAGDGFDLFVAEVYNPGGSVPARDACEDSPDGCRVVRLALDAEGKRRRVPPSVTKLGVQVGSIRDLLPLPDGRVLIADEGRTRGQRSQVCNSDRSCHDDSLVCTDEPHAVSRCRGGTATSDVIRGRLWAATIDGDTAALEEPNDPGPVPLDLQEPVGLALCPASAGRDARVIVADLVTTSQQNVPRLIEIPLDGLAAWRLIVPAGDGVASGDFGPAANASLKSLEGEETSIGLACAPDGTIFVAERIADAANAGLGRIRRIDPDGIIRTFVGATEPLGPSEDARNRGRFYDEAHFASQAPAASDGPLSSGETGVPDDPTTVQPLAIIDANANQESGRVLALGGGHGRSTVWLRVAAGYPRPAPGVSQAAALTPQLDHARGAAWSLDGQHLLVTHRGGTAVRVYEAAGIELSAWLDGGEASFDAVELTSIAADPSNPGEFVVVDEQNACLRRVVGETATTLSLRDCEPVPTGLEPFRPSHVALSPHGVVYVAESDVGRVVRLGSDGFELVYSTEGQTNDVDAPNREFPAEMAFDPWGNLAITLTRRVIVLTDRDGDREPDVGPSQQLLVAYGEPRERYPERSSQCVETIAAHPSGLQVPKIDRPLFVVGDVCLGAAVSIGIDVIDDDQPATRAGRP